MTTLAQANWTDSNYAQILKLLEQEPGLAIFDFDNTLIYNDLGEACMYYVAIQGMLPGDQDQFWELLADAGHLPEPVSKLKAYYNLYKTNDDKTAWARLLHSVFTAYFEVYKQEGMEAAYLWSTLLFGWHKISEWEKISRHVLAEQEAAVLGEARMPESDLLLPQGIRKYQEIEALITALCERGWNVKIVTASPKEIIAAVIPQWGLKPTDVIGMKLKSSPDGTYLPDIIEPMPFAQGKIDILYETLGAKTPIKFAAGDSLGDIELLKQAKQSVLIDRGYPEMRSAARTHQHIMLQPRFINPLVDSNQPESH